jgi:heme exporter protein B
MLSPLAPTLSPADRGEGVGVKPRRPSWVRQAVGIALKDLRIEWHSREIIYTMGFLATLVVLVFSFAFVAGQDAQLAPGTIAGILWVAVLFSGTVALARTFDREREGEAIRSLLLSPVPRSAIYAGKLAATSCLMFLVELVVTPLTAVFFGAPVGAHAPWLALQLLLGTLGFGAAGVVFSAALLRSRSRDALLGALLFPVVVPVLMAGARGTTVLLDMDAPDLGSAVFWTRFLAAVDVVFIAVGMWAFEPVAVGE